MKISKSNTGIITKLALLSGRFIPASLNAITANIPEMAGVFHHAPLYVVELIVTIPSLFSLAALFVVHKLAEIITYKKTALLGFLLCALSGVSPFFIQNLTFILIARAIFGFGTGLVSAAAVALIVRTYEGKERSSMIGFLAAAGGLGSLTTTFIARQLMAVGWQYSFLTYGMAIPVFLVYLFFVPNVVSKTDTTKRQETTKLSSDEKPIFIRFALFTFLISIFATLFIVKVPSFITGQAIGTAQDASIAIMIISLGSLLSGTMYGNIKERLKGKTLPLFMIAMASSYIIVATASSLIQFLIGTIIFGYAFMIVIPYLQDASNNTFVNHTSLATSVILIPQGIGGFISPYVGNIIANLTTNVQHHYLIGAAAFALLTLFATTLHKKN